MTSAPELREREVRVARIDAALELLESSEDVGSISLAAGVCERIAAEPAEHVRDLAGLRPGARGLGVWMSLLARVHQSSAAMFRLGDSGTTLFDRLQRASVVLGAVPMKPLRES